MMFIVYLLASSCLVAATVSAAKRPNVLFLVADDMRPELGAYLGPDYPSSFHAKMHTPNIDKLASRSLLLKRAYVQQAVCAPSRTSALTGRRPDTTRCHDFYHYWRKAAGNFTTIPQYFKMHGYRSIGMGKIFHRGVVSDYDDPPSWSEPYHRADPSHWEQELKVSWTAAPEEKVRKYPLPDMQNAKVAVETLRRLAPEAKSGRSPFFLAVGFHKPHLPFLFPERFLEYYPEADIKLPPNPFAPVGMPEIAWNNFPDLRAYTDIQSRYGYGAINTSLPVNMIKTLRRAYYSAISYTDSLVGEVIDELSALGLSDNTVISFWGDHGWQLGEHGEWEKETNFELATHAPMMIHVPGVTKSSMKVEGLVEFVDLFPTLVDVAGLPSVPLCPRDSSKVITCTEGVSMAPLLKNPSRPWKKAVFSQYPRTDIGGTLIMGYSMRTDKYRFTEWVIFDDQTYSPVWGDKELNDIELYDHVTDPQENINKARDPLYAQLVVQLRKQLKAGWRDAMPPSL